MWTAGVPAEGNNFENYTHTYLVGVIVLFLSFSSYREIWSFPVLLSHITTLVIGVIIEINCNEKWCNYQNAVFSGSTMFSFRLDQVFRCITYFMYYTILYTSCKPRPSSLYFLKINYLEVISRHSRYLYNNIFMVKVEMSYISMIINYKQQNGDTHYI